MRLPDGWLAPRPSGIQPVPPRSRVFFWLAVLALLPTVLLSASAVVALALFGPGAFGVMALDCLSDGRCFTTTVCRLDHAPPHENVGASAYLLGVLFALLAGLSAQLAVHGFGHLLRPLRRTPSVPRRRRYLRHAAFVVGYLVVDSTALLWLIGLAWPRR
jgi:hypothetical protein